VTTRRVAAIRGALQRLHKVDLELTTARGQAAELAREAVMDGAEAIAVYGGDGTLAETFATLAGGNVPLGVIPGGGTNVLARSLGISENPRRAVAQLERALVLGPRRIGLGKADERFFGFVAGIGWDATTVEGVEQRVRYRRALGDLLYFATALATFARYDRRQPSLALHLPDGTVIDDIFYMLVANSTPYTYLGSIPMSITPEAQVNRPLAVAAFRQMSLPFTTAMLLSALRGGRALTRHPDTVVLYDLPRLEVRARRPLDFHLDGDHQGTTTAVTFSFEPAVLPFLS
jgi:diacylglycerol kinase family enzyme